MKTEKEIREALRKMLEYLDKPDEPDILEINLTQQRRSKFRVKIAVLKWVLDEKDGWQKVEAE